MPQRAKKRKRRGVVDTSVLVAGISGFKATYVPGRNPSADLLHKWAEEQTFVWLVSEDILDEYKEVLRRLRVRSHLIGKVVNLSESGPRRSRFGPQSGFRRTLGTIRFVFAQNRAKPTSLLLSTQRTFRKTS